METIANTLSKKKFVITDKPHKRNPLYEQGVALQEQLGNVPLPICIRLVKTYTMNELGQLVSFWKDYPFKKQDNIGLLWWKMEEIRKARNK